MSVEGELRISPSVLAKLKTLPDEDQVQTGARLRNHGGVLAGDTYGEAPAIEEFGQLYENVARGEEVKPKRNRGSRQLGKWATDSKLAQRISAEALATHAIAVDFRTRIRQEIAGRFPVCLDTNILINAMARRHSVSNGVLADLIADNQLIMCDIPKMRQEQVMLFCKPESVVTELINTYPEDRDRVLGLWGQALNIFSPHHRLKYFIPKSVPPDDRPFLEGLIRLLDIIEKDGEGHPLPGILRTKPRRAILVTGDAHLTQASQDQSDIAFRHAVYNPDQFLELWNSGQLSTS